MKYITQNLQKENWLNYKGSLKTISSPIYKAGHYMLLPYMKPRIWQPQEGRKLDPWMTAWSRNAHPSTLSSLWVHAKSLQLCPTLCDPMNYSPPGSSFHGFSGQEYCSGLPCPPPGDLLYPGSNLSLLEFPALVGAFFTTSTAWEAGTLSYRVRKNPTTWI